MPADPWARFDMDPQPASGSGAADPWARFNLDPTVPAPAQEAFPTTMQTMGRTAWSGISSIPGMAVGMVRGAGEGALLFPREIAAAAGYGSSPTMDQLRASLGHAGAALGAGPAGPAERLGSAVEAVPTVGPMVMGTLRGAGRILAPAVQTATGGAGSITPEQMNAAADTAGPAIVGLAAGPVAARVPGAAAKVAAGASAARAAITPANVGKVVMGAAAVAADVALTGGAVTGSALLTKVAFRVLWKHYGAAGVTRGLDKLAALAKGKDLPGVAAEIEKAVAKDPKLAEALAAELTAARNEKAFAGADAAFARDRALKPWQEVGEARRLAAIAERPAAKASITGAVPAEAAPAPVVARGGPRSAQAAPTPEAPPAPVVEAPATPPPVDPATVAPGGWKEVGIMRWYGTEGGPTAADWAKMGGAKMNRAWLESRNLLPGRATPQDVATAVAHGVPEARILELYGEERLAAAQARRTYPVPESGTAGAPPAAPGAPSGAPGAPGAPPTPSAAAPTSAKAAPPGAEQWRTRGGSKMQQAQQEPRHIDSSLKRPVNVAGKDHPTTGEPAGDGNVWVRDGDKVVKRPEAQIRPLDEDGQVIHTEDAGLGPDQRAQIIAATKNAVAEVQHKARNQPLRPSRKPGDVVDLDSHGSDGARLPTYEEWLDGTPPDRAGRVRFEAEMKQRQDPKNGTIFDGMPETPEQLMRAIGTGSELEGRIRAVVSKAVKEMAEEAAEEAARVEAAELRRIFGSDDELSAPVEKPRGPTQTGMFGQGALMQGVEAMVTEGREALGDLFTQESRALAKADAQRQMTFGKPQTPAERALMDKQLEAAEAAGVNIFDAFGMSPAEVAAAGKASAPIGKVQGAKTVWHGDRAEYTGATKPDAGGPLYVLRLLEGHRKGSTVVTYKAPGS